MAPIVLVSSCLFVGRLTKRPISSHIYFKRVEPLSVVISGVIIVIIPYLYI